MKNLIYKIFFIALLVVGLQTTTSASHVIGGQLTYQCLGNNMYELLLEFRRDCFNGAVGAEFDDPVSIGVFDADGNFLDEILIDFMEDDTLNEVLTSECQVLGEDVCVQITEYRKVVELPVQEGGYILSYQRCCRNRTIFW